MGNVDWFEAIKTFASLAAVLLAYLALKNWKQQDSAKRQVEFLDQLIEASQAFVTSMLVAVELLRTAHIGIASHAPQHKEGAAPSVEGAIAFITKNSWGVGERMGIALVDIRPFVVRLRSLADKGQIFGFPDFAEGNKNVVQLTLQYDRIWGFYSIISAPSLNWSSPDVLTLLEKIIKIDPEEVRAGLVEHHQNIIHFATTAHQKLYK